ncbi:cutinase family protein [Streptomyces sp. SAS_276]|uniref:cutinase family protein n=1 Tax=Streptomyces sp. SAS_276 TaxID=3412745 RepID=UPI00403C949A
MAADCANTSFIPRGCSQGGRVTDIAFGIRTGLGSGRAFPAGLADRVKAVVVFGDRLRERRQRRRTPDIPPQRQCRARGAISRRADRSGLSHRPARCLRPRGEHRGCIFVGDLSAPGETSAPRFRRFICTGSRTR